MNRLYEKGFISNPVGKAESVLLTEKGLRESERLFSKLFVKMGWQQQPWSLSAIVTTLVTVWLVACCRRSNAG